ncbi:hypothetical protein IM774_07745 [Erysipelotrichaceae bacterium RD49]|nr:hypothetical protein [Erysipelotrichaceae bacterium RD49]
MNKKIFAALASATMALSATGSLAVFAEDFDVVTEADGNNGAGAGVINPAKDKVTLDSENFPDKNFRDSIIAAIPGASYGDKVDAKKFNAVTTLTINNSLSDTPTGVFTNDDKDLTLTVKDIKDLSGIALFPNISTLVVDTETKLVTADLSSNSKLANVTITGASSLETLKVPAGNTLRELKVIADAGQTAPITVLDLSSNKQLRHVTIKNTLIAKLDLSNNVYLQEATLGNNDLNTLDLTNCGDLTSLYVSDNDLYGLELPENAKLGSLWAANNLIQEIDLTGQNQLTSLDLTNNELKTLDLSDCTSLSILLVANNHLGALDVSKMAKDAAYNITYTPQVVYVDSAYDAVNLKETFDGFKIKNIVTSNDFNDETGVLTLDDNGEASYTYKTGKVGTTEFEPMGVKIITASVLNRVYNPNSGEHFYTADIEEKDALVNLGWQDEGIGWVSPTESSKPVFRLYNPNAGDHHYTQNAFERDTLVNVGWKYEGIGWYSYTNNKSYTVAGESAHINPVNVLRQYNPNAKAAGAHNYTMNPAENDFLVSVGWLDEGLAWDAMK